MENHATPPDTPPPGSGNFQLWKLAFAALIIAYIISPLIVAPSTVETVYYS